MKKMMDLKRRFLVSIILGALVALLIVFSTYPLVSALLLCFTAALAAVGVWEYSKLAISKGLQPHGRAMVFVAVAQVLALYASLLFVDFPQLPIFVLASAMVFFFLLRFSKTHNALTTIGVEFFGIAYVAAPLSLTLGVLYPVAHLGVPQEGRLWLVYLIVVTKITDMAAYFVGRLWGKRQLAALLSPKKTVEGALAGLVSAIVASVLFHFVDTPGFSLSLTESIWLGALVGVFGQIGDLAESLLKRDADVKDSNVLPGLGGVLDMVDSLLFTAPIVYFFIRMH